MTLLPDVPLVVVIAHVVALAALLVHGLVTSWQRLALLRQNVADLQDSP